MNGLRSLASKEETRFTFPPDTRYNNATTIEVLPDLYEPGVSHWRKQFAVDHLLLAKFLERGGPALSTPGNEDQGENRRTNYGTKLVIVATETWNYILMNKSIFQDIVSTLNPDPLFNRIFHARYYPYFEFSGSIANGGIATMKLRVSRFLFMLSIRQHDEDPAFDSRCLVLRAVQGVGSAQSVEDNRLCVCLEDLKEEARSPLYLPFALSVYTIYGCRDALSAIQQCVKSAATITSDAHFGEAYGVGNGTTLDRNRVVEQNRWIEFALSHAAFVTSVLNGVESLWEYLGAMAEEISPSAKTEQVVQSTNNILEAIRFLRQEVKGMREAARHGEVRIRDQALLISAHLSHRDSETNIENAIASRDFAAAAHEDSSAMKSIAILTMFFLPGTFFAALFSMPALGWDQPQHFPRYWEFTIPATILTFAIWAALTQRSVVLRWFRMLWLNWPWGFWRGKRGEDLERGEEGGGRRWFEG